MFYIDEFARFMYAPYALIFAGPKNSYNGYVEQTFTWILKGESFTIQKGYT